MAFTAQSALEYIKANGPVVPNQLRQALGGQDNFVVGAILSELVSSQKLAITQFSHGTSKFYYDPEHPESIEPLGVHLNEKDQRAFQLLKTERVLRHTDLTPLNRVALAQIKDYSRPLKLMTPEGEALFWRYFLVTEEEAMDLIEERYFGHYKPKSVPVPAPTFTPAPSPAPVPTPALGASPAQVAPMQQTLQGIAPSSSTPATAPSSSKAKRAPAKRKSASAKGAKSTAEDVAKLPSAAAQDAASELPAQSNEFAQLLVEYFKEKQIGLVQNLASTKAEFSGIVRVPSAVGAVEYFCKAKSKKTTTDGDLASAVLESQQYKLPLLFISAGALTKKAKDIIPGLKGVVVVQPWS